MRLNKDELASEVSGGLRLNTKEQTRVLKQLFKDPISTEEAWSHPADVLENISEAVIFADCSLRILNWNKAAERMYGWKKEEVLYKNILTVLQPESPHFDLTSVVHQIQKEGCWKKELNSRDKNGSFVYVSSTVYLAYDAKGRPNGVFAINHNITHLKFAEQALQHHENRFRTLVQNSSDVIVVLKADGIRSYSSPSVERVFGRSSHDFLSRDLMEYVHPDDRISAQSAFSTIMQVPDLPVQSEFRFQHADGSWLYIDCVISNQLDELGVEGIVVNMRDITKTRIAERLLENSEARLRALMQYSSDIICIIRTDSTISYLSPSVERILGYTVTELVSSPIVSLIHSDDLSNTDALFQDLIKQPGTSVHIEFRVKHKLSGKWIYLDCVGSNQIDNPSIGGIIMNVRDITDRKEAELRLTHVLEELERRNHELDHYVYKVSHDLRAPLCSILGLANLIRTENDLPTVKQYNDLIVTSVNKLDHFIQSILHHSRTLNTELSIGRINFKKIVNDCFEELKYLPNSGRMHVTTSIQRKGEFYSDEFRLAILFKNFISNSIKYLNQSLEYNFINFDISFADQAATIVISDNGIGIDRKYISKIFNMFFRGTERSAGSGLGLYIVKQTVQKLRGTIEVASEAGKGTTFTLVLPNLKL